MGESGYKENSAGAGRYHNEPGNTSEDFGRRYADGGRLCLCADCGYYGGETHERIDSYVPSDPNKTGIEMEALTAASVAALTIYDMCKAVDRGMRIDEVFLLYKAGGKSGDFRRSDG